MGQSHYEQQTEKCDVKLNEVASCKGNKQVFAGAVLVTSALVKLRFFNNEKEQI